MKQSKTFQIVKPLLELTISLPVGLFMINLLFYYLLMGYEFVKILEQQFNVSRRKYWLFYGTMVTIILITWINAALMYIVVPMAQLMRQEVCSQMFLSTSLVFLVIGYWGPYFYGIFILFIMDYFASNKNSEEEEDEDDVKNGQIKRVDSSTQENSINMSSFNDSKFKGMLGKSFITDRS